MKLTKSILFLLYIVIYLGSCKSNFRLEQNPYYEGCTINGSFGRLMDYKIDDYINGIRKEVQSKFKINEELNEILLLEIYDGGNGVHELKLILFNLEKIIPVKVTIQFKDKKAITKSISLGTISKQEHKQVFSIYETLKHYGEWNINVECLSLTTEQRVLFYVKERNEYKYFARFENFYFSENPSIGIDKKIMNLIKIVESY